MIVLAVLSAVPLAVKAGPAVLKAVRSDGTEASALVLAPSSAAAPSTPTPTQSAPPKKAAPPAAAAGTAPRLATKHSAQLTVPETRAEVVSKGSCEASFYGEGQATASGESFDPSELTAAHRTLPFGSKVRVTNQGNDESVVVRINDRGPFVSGRCLDLSTAAMRAVDGVSSGVIQVTYEVLAA